MTFNEWKRDLIAREPYDAGTPLPEITSPDVYIPETRPTDPDVWEDEEEVVGDWLVSNRGRFEPNIGSTAKFMGLIFWACQIRITRERVDRLTEAFCEEGLLKPVEANDDGSPQE